MNEQQRRAEAQREELKRFAAQFAMGQAKAIDRYGNDIRVGDRLQMKFGIDPVVEVVAVNPSLNPRHQIGTIEVQCTVSFPLHMQSGQPFQFANIVARREQVDAQVRPDSNGNGLSLVPTPPPEPSPTGDQPPGDEDDGSTH